MFKKNERWREEVKLIVSLKDEETKRLTSKDFNSKIFKKRRIELKVDKQSNRHTYKRTKRQRDTQTYIQIDSQLNITIFYCKRLYKLKV